jgi:NAD(P)H-dependent FMN reductase
VSRVKALLLVGSPRGERSNSNAFGSYLMKKIGSCNAEVSSEYAVRLANSPAGLEKLTAAVNGADVIVIAAPLYIDSIPVYMIRALEHIRDARKAEPIGKRQRRFVIVNSGFPEPGHNYIALDMYRLFARETGMEWSGGIPRGWGHGSRPQAPGIFGRYDNAATQRPRPDRFSTGKGRARPG